MSSVSWVKLLVLVSIYIMFVNQKMFEFSDRLTFSNIRGKTSRQIYRLALLLCAPETLTSLSKSRKSLFNVHLALFVQRMTQLQSHNPIRKYRHLIN